ncbi:MAG: hypothetical protein WD048_05350 [Chitinophagales bacterium]
METAKSFKVSIKFFQKDGLGGFVFCEQEPLRLFLLGWGIH